LEACGKTYMLGKEKVILIILVTFALIAHFSNGNKNKCHLKKGHMGAKLAEMLRPGHDAGSD
jgi:hypothetical protein